MKTSTAVQLPFSRWFVVVGRLALYSELVLVFHWVKRYLGGWAATPVPIDATKNSTTGMLNLHVTLMVLGVILMGEALLAYSSPPIRLSRPYSKMLHGGLHCAAFLCLSGGLAVVFQSHSLRLPKPLSDLYSVHSYVGLAAFILGGLQFVIGFSAYWFPKLPVPVRQGLSPSHIWWGKASWLLFVAAILTGLQEKATFAQLHGKVKVDSYSPQMRIPAVMALLTCTAAACVMYVHSAAQPGDKLQEEEEVPEHQQAILAEDYVDSAAEAA